MKCASCGAEIPPGAGKCEFCDSVCGPAESLDREGSRRENVFDQIKQSPQYARHNAPDLLASLPAPPILATVIPLVFLVGFVGVALFMMSVVSEHGAPCVFIFMPLIFVVVGVLSAIHVIRQFLRYQQAPAMGRAAIIVGKRTQVSGGSGNSSAKTAYYLTAQFENGRREEFTTWEPKLYSIVAEGDAGVLFTRADAAVAFDRVTSTRL